MDFQRKRQKDKISIGIFGVEIGCGATHLAIALANYLQSGLGRKSAVVELSGQNELKALTEREGNEQRELLGVRYFTGICQEQVPEIFNSRYEAFVLDLGTDFVSAREELLRCDRKIVIGSISPWKVSAYQYFIEQITMQQHADDWEYLCLFGDRHDARKIQKRYGIHMLVVPFLENPFYLKRQDIAFLQKII